jgi:hypothetical protein
MNEAAACLRVRYEDLCLQLDTYERVKTFVGSPIPKIGDVGSFNASNARRVDEYDLHGDQITDKRVGRWRQEEAQVRAEAQRTFELMPDYCAFWEYAA